MYERTSDVFSGMTEIQDNMLSETVGVHVLCMLIPVKSQQPDSSLKG